MASLMENLIQVLEQESEEYEGLLSLSQKKTPIIVSSDLEKLQKITDDEQVIVSRINQTVLYLTVDDHDLRIFKNDRCIFVF